MKSMDKMKETEERGDDKVKMNSKTREERAITLVALVVTIVVLLILAGVSLSLVLGNNGIVKEAQEARLKTQIDTEKEQIGLVYDTLKINKDTTGEEITEEKMNDELVAQGVDATASGEYPMIVTYTDSKRMYEINDTSGAVEIPSEDMSYIFEYDASTGYITGIKNEYLEYVTNKSYSQEGNKIQIASLNSYRLANAVPSFRKLIDEIGTYLKIPEKIDETDIIGIDSRAFAGIINIKNVYVPSSIQYIGSFAFEYCYGLESISIPTSVQSVGYAAFFYSEAVIYVPFKESETPTGWVTGWERYGNTIRYKE